MSVGSQRVDNDGIAENGHDGEAKHDGGQQARVEQLRVAEQVADRRRMSGLIRGRHPIEVEI